MKFKDKTMGFATITWQVMLVHLITTYGPIKPMGLDANWDHLIAPWTPEELIEDLWKCICNCQVFAAASDKAITDATMMHLMLIIFKTQACSTVPLTNGKTSPPHKTP